MLMVVYHNIKSQASLILSTGWMPPASELRLFQYNPCRKQGDLCTNIAKTWETPWNSSTLLVFGGLYVDSMENLITNRFHGKLIAMVCWKKKPCGWLIFHDFPIAMPIDGGFPRISQPCLMTGGGLHHRLRQVHILYTSPTFVDCIPMCPQVALRYPAWYYIYIYMTFNVHQLLHRNADIQQIVNMVFTWVW